MRQGIVRAARSLIDVPWHHQGCNQFGCDCIGVGVFAARSVGVKIGPLPPYKRVGKASIMIDVLNQYADRLDPCISFFAAPLGSLILFLGEMLTATSSDRKINMCHVSVKVARTRMVHSYLNIGRVIEEEFSGHWQGFLHGIWDLKVLRE